jgi:hypothetical protein
MGIKIADDRGGSVLMTASASAARCITAAHQFNFDFGERPRSAPFKQGSKKMRNHRRSPHLGRLFDP